MNPVRENTLLREAAIDLAKTDLPGAMAKADKISDQDTKSNTKSKVIEAWLKSNLTLDGYVAAVPYVSHIDLSGDQAKALERILRLPERAPLTADGIESLQQKVAFAARELGVNPYALAEKRAAKTTELHENALNASTAPEAFYLAAHCPTDKPKILGEVVKKFGLDQIRSSQAERELIFKEKLAPLPERMLKANSIENDVKKNREIDRIAFEYTSMGMLDEALKVLKTITDPNILKHTISRNHSITRLVEYLAPERLEQFTSLRCEEMQ